MELPMRLTTTTHSIPRVAVLMRLLCALRPSDGYDLLQCAHCGCWPCRMITGLRCRLQRGNWTSRALIVDLGEGRLVTNNAGDLAAREAGRPRSIVSAVLADAVLGRSSDTAHLEATAANQIWECPAPLPSSGNNASKRLLACLVCCRNE
jgi:hypothetical protein